METFRFFFVLILSFVPTFANLKDKPCKNLLPGVTLLRKGVDITKLDILPLDVVRDNGFRKPIIEFTCNEGMTSTVLENGAQVSVLSKKNLTAYHTLSSDPPLKRFFLISPNGRFLVYKLVFKQFSN